mgnify:CR=1 FL=1
MTSFSEKSEKTHIALIHETWRESAARDLTTAAIFLGLWSVGHFAGSAALEWVGVFFGGLSILARVLAVFKRSVDTRMTPDEAREWLDTKFPPEGQP